MYSVQTTDNVPKLMQFGGGCDHTFCTGFIRVTDLKGRFVYVNTNNILSIKESEGDVLNFTDQVIKSTLASFGLGVSTPKKEETIRISDEEVDE